MKLRRTILSEATSLGYLIPNTLGMDSLVCNISGAYVAEQIILAASTTPGAF